MSTITIKVPVEPQTKEVELALPCYRKNGGTYCMILSQQESIILSPIIDYISHINIIPTHAFDVESIEVTESQFMEAFGQAMANIQLKVEQAIANKNESAA